MEEMNLKSLTGNDATLLPHQEEDKILPYFLTAQPMGSCHYSANEKSLYFKLSVSSGGLFIYNGSSQVHKKVFLSFISQDSRVICHLSTCPEFVVPK